ncbi:MAG: YunC family protein [Candidatus Bathycorpusculaceae bacterium]
MIRIKPLDIQQSTVLGVEIGNPENPEKPAIIVIIAKRGLIVCGNFDINELDKRNVCAARVVGLTKVEDALQKSIVSVTSRAKAIGISAGMTGIEALKIMS